jgi:hydrogenase maturation factor HypE
MPPSFQNGAYAALTAPSGREKPQDVEEMPPRPQNNLNKHRRLRRQALEMIAARHAGHQQRPEQVSHGPVP